MSALRAKSLGEPSAPSDGLRVLATRYRPRGVAKGAETWARWDRRVAPSVALLDAYLGRRREGRKVVARDLEPLPWTDFAARYRRELEAPEARAALAELRSLVAGGEAVTVLCHCPDPARCHRTLLVEAIRQAPPGE